MSDDDEEEEYRLEDIACANDLRKSDDVESKMAAKMAEPEVVELEDDEDDEVEEESPEVVMIRDQLTLTEGDTATMQCHVTGTPIPKVKWRKGECV